MGPGPGARSAPAATRRSLEIYSRLALADAQQCYNDVIGERLPQGRPYWRLERVSANRWELERIDGTWRVIRRTNRLLDGTPQARRLLTPPGR